MQLESALDDAIEIDGFSAARQAGRIRRFWTMARRSRPDVSIPAGVWFRPPLTISKQFRDAEDSGERLLSRARHRRASGHGGELSAWMAVLRALEIGDIAPRKDHAFDFPVSSARAEIERMRRYSPVVAHADSRRGESLAPARIAEWRLQFGKVFRRVRPPNSIGGFGVHSRELPCIAG